ncbi:MAG: hypothetical protein K2M48_02880 [Clostridiales bacterium]|nr:hypothetical protein [Clostridiales bacterium]
MEEFVRMSPPATPENWHWQITPEQIARIKQRDRDTVNQVYFDNLNKFKKMAYSFCGKRKLYSYFWDCVQQVYVDMLDYDYTDTRSLFWSIRHSFWLATGITKRPFISLDEPVFDDEITLGDIIPTYDTTERDFERSEQEKHVLELISAQTHLSDKQRDILTAYAFDCLAYRGLFEYAYREICAVQYRR